MANVITLEHVICFQCLSEYKHQPFPAIHIPCTAWNVTFISMICHFHCCPRLFLHNNLPTELLMIRLAVSESHSLSHRRQQQSPDHCHLSSNHPNLQPLISTRSLTLIVRSTVHYPEQYLTLFYLNCDLLTLLSPRTPPAILQCVSCFPVLPSSTIPEKESLISSLPCHIGLDHHTSHAPAPLTSRNSTCQ